jgi:hypothetical protein
MVFIGTITFSCQAENQAGLIQFSPNKIDAVPFPSDDEPTILIGKSVLNLEGYFVWGGTVIKGNDNKYHMVFSLWKSDEPNGSFSRNWVLESKLGYAVSDYPDKNFEFKKIILEGTRYQGDTLSWDAQSVHNPHVKKFKNKYYLYYTGSKDPGTQPPGSTGEGLDQRSRVQQSQCIGVIEFNNFDDLLTGQFFRPDKPILQPRTRVKKDHIVNGSRLDVVAKPDNIIVVNPSVVFNPLTSEYMLYFKGNLYEPHWKGAHGVAIGSSPIGPFKAIDKFMFDVKLPNGKIASTEDPYVWYTARYDTFFAVVKDFSGQLSGVTNSLAMLYSEDGIQWNLAKNSLFMKRELYLKNGDTIAVNNLERPQLLLDDEGIPQVLYAACSIVNMGARNDACTFNVHVPLLINQ